MECRTVGCPVCDKVFGCLCGSGTQHCITCEFKEKCEVRNQEPVVLEMCTKCYAIPKEK